MKKFDERYQDQQQTRNRLVLAASHDSSSFQDQKRKELMTPVAERRAKMKSKTRIGSYQTNSPAVVDVNE